MQYLDSSIEFATLLAFCITFVFAAWYPTWTYFFVSVLVFEAAIYAWYRYDDVWWDYRKRFFVLLGTLLGFVLGKAISRWTTVYPGSYLWKEVKVSLPSW